MTIEASFRYILHFRALVVLIRRAFPLLICILRFGPMKVVRSLKTIKNRHKASQVVRRRGRIYVINKVVRKFKARQG